MRTTGRLARASDLLATCELLIWVGRRQSCILVTIFQWLCVLVNFFLGFLEESRRCIRLLGQETWSSCRLLAIRATSPSMFVPDGHPAECHQNRSCAGHVVRRKFPEVCS